MGNLQAVAFKSAEELHLGGFKVSGLVGGVRVWVRGSRDRGVQVVGGSQSILHAERCEACLQCIM